MCVIFVSLWRKWYRTFKTRKRQAETNKQTNAWTNERTSLWVYECRFDSRWKHSTTHTINKIEFSFVVSSAHSLTAVCSWNSLPPVIRMKFLNLCFQTCVCVWVCCCVCWRVLLFSSDLILLLLLFIYFHLAVDEIVLQQSDNRHFPLIHFKAKSNKPKSRFFVHFSWYNIHYSDSG